MKKAVDDVIAKELRKNSRSLSAATIRPISDDWQFSTNGVYFLCGKMGSGKTYTIIRHILMTERLSHQSGFCYDLIVFTSTSGSMDKTVCALGSKIKTPVMYVKDDQLVSFLTKHIKNKMKYYALMEYVHEGKDSDELKRIVEKYSMYRLYKGKRVYDDKKIAMYLMRCIERYGFKQIPSNTLLVMDDFAGHPLLKDVNSPLARMLTKTRHYHLTAILAVQTWRFVNLNFKRLCTDIVIWKGYSEEDFKNMIRQTPNDKNWKELWQQYKSLTDAHSNMALHITSGNVLFNE